MTSNELEKLIRDLIEESISSNDLRREPDTPARKLLLVEVEEGDFHRYSDAVREAINSEFNVIITNCTDALKSERSIPLLITALPLNVQAKAVQGIADCPLSILLQDCFVKGRDIIILKSSLAPLSEITSFNYRKLFSAYQRKLSEYGLRIVEINQLVNPSHRSSFLVAANIMNLPAGSQVDIDKDCIISYAANEIIRDKKLNIIRR
ncbi:MAG: hypothetical protein IJ815_04620 [Lachnospiraceae bacterium]|nr:hypothetical protein [Lachnospiraceae bacterium]MCR5776435.1 hypothetical protein [Lachnospiraceae bacterium]